MYASGEYRRDNPTWHLEDARWKAAKVARILELNGVSPSSIADLGCGVGGVLAELRGLDVARSYYGFDISPDAIAEAQASRGHGIDFIVGHPVAGQTYSAVLLLDVLEHVSDPHALLATAGSAGEYLVAHIPLELNVLGALRPASLMFARRTVGHINHYCKETALAMIDEAGFDIVASEITAGAIELEGGGTKRKIAKLPRRVGHSASPELAARLLGGFSLLVLARSRGPR